ncbi:MAG: hypothetical protein B6D77_16160, partial [gamma proteobacterium symbiont of Ctena orbiculata]
PNLVMDIKLFPINAAKMTFLEPEAIYHSQLKLHPTSIGNAQAQSRSVYPFGIRTDNQNLSVMDSAAGAKSNTQQRNQA